MAKEADEKKDNTSTEKKVTAKKTVAKKAAAKKPADKKVEEKKAPEKKVTLKKKAEEKEAKRILKIEKKCASKSNRGNTEYTAKRIYNNCINEHFN